MADPSVLVKHGERTLQFIVVKATLEFDYLIGANSFASF